MKEFVLALVCVLLLSQAADSFDGRKWHVSTGNLSVSFIQASPIGALAKPGYVMEPPPSVESLKAMKDMGLVSFEDYVAWGALEREPGKWDWTQHDKVYEAVKAAGLEYVVYNWCHFPPVWLREGKDRTLMRCIEHKQEANYLSIWDPKTIEYYDHFYKNLHDHFGDKIDAVYACILGPYGEGNYPLYVPDFINMGHCHEGYWCEDPYALSAFKDAMRAKFGNISPLNMAWGTDFASFSQVRPPKEIAQEGFKPNPEAFKTGTDRRRWIDFLAWYHQSMIDFTEKSIKVTLKYFPREKVRTKPGGNAHGVNPIAWGTYCPGYAKMAKDYGIVLQPADCIGACYGDKWVGTAYNFYGVTLSTEPAGGLARERYVRRMFSDASCGAAQHFTYEFTDHAADIQKYIHLYTGQPGDTDVAIVCPTALYRLGGDFGPSIRAADNLRDVTDFDVLDELLVQDGILDVNHYRALIILQGDYIEQPVLDKIEKWVKAGGMLIDTSLEPVRNVNGDEWPVTQMDQSDKTVRTRTLGKGSVVRFFPTKDEAVSFESFRTAVLPFLKSDDTPDGVWTTKRGKDIFCLNLNDKPAKFKYDGREIEIPAHEIWSSK